MAKEITMFETMELMVAEQAFTKQEEIDEFMTNYESFETNSGVEYFITK